MIAEPVVSPRTSTELVERIEYQTRRYVRQRFGFSRYYPRPTEFREFLIHEDLSDEQALEMIRQHQNQIWEHDPLYRD